MKHLFKAWLALLFLLLFSTSSNAYDLTFAWDSVENAWYYTLYWGTESRVYPNSARTGRTKYTVYGLAETQTHFIAVTASNRNGESGYSDELQYPDYRGAQNIRVSSIGQEEPPIMTTVNGTLAANADDCQIYYDSGWQFSDGVSTIWFGNWNDVFEGAYTRFVLDAAIPSGATINSAPITYTGQGDTAVQSAYLYVTESSDAGQVTAASQRPAWAGSGSTTTYPTTEAHANAIHWTGTWPSANNTVQIDIASLVQHLVDIYGGLSSGAHIGVWIDSSRDEGTTDENSFYSKDNGEKYAYLTIDYTEGGGTPSAIPMANNTFRQLRN